MGYTATEVLEDAYDATRHLLLPFSLRRWVILGVVVLFVGWTSGFVGSTNLSPTWMVDLPGFADPGVDFEVSGAWSLALAPFFLLIGLIALVGGLVVAVLSSILQFVFVRQLTEQSVRLRGFVGQSVDPGLRLLVLWFAVVLAIAVVAIAAVVLTIVTFGLFAIVLLALLPLLFVAMLALWVFVRFTIDFVVPIMLVDERGIIDAWRQLLDEVQADWAEFGVYAVIRAILDIAAGIVQGLAAALTILVLAIPAFLVGVVAVGATGLVSSTLAAAIAVVLALVVVVLTLVVTTVLIGVPIQTYLRYYALFVLADLVPRYDLLDEVRRSLDGESAESGQ